MKHTMTEKEFLGNLLLMVNEKNLPYPAPWKQVPEFYKKEFKGWVADIKQQSWDEMWEKGWDNYGLEFLHYIIEVRINEIEEDK